jgi:hypothetical protein
MKLSRLHQHAETEPYWHVYLAVVVAICLQFGLSNKLTVGPKYLVTGLELLLLAALILFAPHKHRTILHLRRGVAILFVAVISLANVSSLVLIIHDLFTSFSTSGRQLLVSALAIYLTNIIIFGLWYWELDDNGGLGQDTANGAADFLFPQMTLKSIQRGGRAWAPAFMDYLYLSVTNASAFSPTDTLPLTHRAKLLMTLQSVTSLITIVLVTARAVNILS